MVINRLIESNFATDIADMGEARTGVRGWKRLLHLTLKLSTTLPYGMAPGLSRRLAARTTPLRIGPRAVSGGRMLRRRVDRDFSETGAAPSWPPPCGSARAAGDLLMRASSPGRARRSVLSYIDIGRPDWMRFGRSARACFTKRIA